MKNELLGILEDMEKNIPMTFRAPAAANDFARIAAHTAPVPPAKMIALWGITDGMEIHAPGTVFYSIREAALRLMECDDRFAEGWFPAGRMNFGDELYMAADGRIVQIDHEDGSEFLDWPDLETFLIDALRDEEAGL